MTPAARMIQKYLCDCPCREMRQEMLVKLDALVEAEARLSAIENAGDEEVDAILGAAAADLDGERNADVLDAAYKIANIAKSRGIERDSLRAKCEELEREVERLGDHLGRSADGVLLIDCINVAMYCPHCSEKVDGDSFTAYCENCVNPDDGQWPHRPPLPLFWEACNSKPIKKGGAA